MDIICPKCNHSHHFDVEVIAYKGFVCSSCHSYFKASFGEGQLQPTLQFVKQFTFKSSDILTYLNEKINQFKNPYYTTTIIVRKNIYTKELSYEYVLQSDKKQNKYYSHGKDYFCDLIKENEKAVKFESSDRSKIRNVTYLLESSVTNEVIYAEGFVYEDLEKTSLCETFVHNYDENIFLSVETFEDQKEFYRGKYLQSVDFNNLFEKTKALKINKEDAYLLFYKICTIAFLLLGILFLGLNFNNLKLQNFQFYEIFDSNESSVQFIGRSFELKGNPKPLIFEGIGESNLSDVILQVKLVNEKTNEVQISNTLSHYNNDINYASGITIDFCKVQKGIYHLVFDISKNQELPIEYKIDYRLTYGDVDYSILFIGALILLLICGIYHKALFETDQEKFYTNSLRIDYNTILRQTYFGYVLTGFILIFSIYVAYTNFLKDCTSATSSTLLEDHTYTGSRSHYYRSYYSDGSGHK